MAIALVNTSVSTSATANSLTPSEPTGATTGDLILAFVGINQSGGTWTDPADFTQLDAQDAGSGDEIMNVYVGYKVRDATAGSGYAFSTTAAVEQMSAVLVAWRGVDQTTPLDVTFVAASHQNDFSDDLTSAAPAITTVTNESEVVILQHMVGAVAGITFGEPSGYTIRQSNLNASRSNFVVSKNVAVAGTETPGAFTTAGTAANHDIGNWTIALRPEVVAATARGRMLLTGIG